MYKQTFFRNVSILFAFFVVLSGCQIKTTETPEEQRVTELADNVKAVEQEEQLEKTDGDLYDQSNLSDPYPDATQ